MDITHRSQDIRQLPLLQVGRTPRQGDAQNTNTCGPHTVVQSATSISFSPVTLLPASGVDEISRTAAVGVIYSAGPTLQRHYIFYMDGRFCYDYM